MTTVTGVATLILQRLAMVVSLTITNELKMVVGGEDRGEQGERWGGGDKEKVPAMSALSLEPMLPQSTSLACHHIPTPCPPPPLFPLMGTSWSAANSTQNTLLLHSSDDKHNSAHAAGVSYMLYCVPT